MLLIWSWLCRYSRYDFFLIINASIFFIVKRIGLNRQVEPVQPGTEPEVGPVFTIKPNAIKIDQESAKTGKNRWTGPVKPIDRFVLFLKKNLVKMLLFLLLKKNEEGQSEQKFISFRTLILLVCLFALYF